MFKISEFSKLSRIPIQTLRYYDQIGILKPAVTDEIQDIGITTRINY